MLGPHTSTDHLGELAHCGDQEKHQETNVDLEEHYNGPMQSPLGEASKAYLGVFDWDPKNILHLEREELSYVTSDPFGESDRSADEVDTMYPDPFLHSHNPCLYHQRH